MRSKVQTVKKYLTDFPNDRKEAINKFREIIITTFLNI
jgi:hypothetical protein